MVGHAEAGFGCLLSSNDKQFILQALKDEHRVNGRRPLDFRTPQIKVSLDGSTVTLSLGKTLVTTSITASITPPSLGRPNEGLVQLIVDYSGMAAAVVDISSRAGEESTSEVQVMLDKAIRNIKAVDPETLCIVPALMAFKRPDVTVEAGEGGGAPMITVHPVEEREAIPLTLHQAPMAVSFALFQDGETLVVDPSSKEEAAACAAVTVVLNAHSEVLLLQKMGGLGLSLAQIMYLVKVAQAKISMLGEKVKAALEAHETARVASRVRRQQPQSRAGQGSSSFSASQASKDVVSGEVLRQAVGKELEALELAAAELSESSDEGMEDASGNQPQDTADGAEQPVGIGVRAPSLDTAAEPLATDGLDEAVAQESLRTEGGVELEPLAIEQDIGQKPKTYQDMAAAIAGPSIQGASLSDAVHRKKRKKSRGTEKKTM